jgi:FkbM family methyltransferase
MKGTAITADLIMKKGIIRKIKDRIELYLNGNAIKSWSQCGEDIITDFILRNSGIFKPTYLDIGANHPHKINNTCFFYKKGCSGVLIEPDPALVKTLKSLRPRDQVLNCGVGTSNNNIGLDFFVMSNPTLNTFSKKNALASEAEGTHKIKKTLKIPVKDINFILESWFPPKDDTTGGPDIFSMDIEGFELQILEKMDFNRFRPFVMIIETLTYSENKKEEKLDNIIEFVKSKGYMVYADTYINTIFVAREKWQNQNV